VLALGPDLTPAAVTRALRGAEGPCRLLLTTPDLGALADLSLERPALLDALLPPWAALRARAACWTGRAAGSSSTPDAGRGEARVSASAPLLAALLRAALPCLRALDLARPCCVPVLHSAICRVVVQHRGCAAAPRKSRAAAPVPPPGRRRWRSIRRSRRRPAPPALHRRMGDAPSAWIVRPRQRRKAAPNPVRLSGTSHLNAPRALERPRLSEEKGGRETCGPRRMRRSRGTRMSLSGCRRNKLARRVGVRSSSWCPGAAAGRVPRRVALPTLARRCGGARWAVG
jgi:hypothetical protein